jgi:hypothetical protein
MTENTNLFSEENLSEFIYLKYNDNDEMVVTISDELSSIKSKTAKSKFGEQTYLCLEEGLLKVDSVRLRRALFDCIEEWKKAKGFKFPIKLLIKRSGSGFKTKYQVSKSNI